MRNPDLPAPSGAVGPSFFLERLGCDAAPM